MDARAQFDRDSADGHTVAPVKIGEGYHGSVELDYRNQIVCKQFNSTEREQVSAYAQREYEYLNRLFDVLASLQYVRCPEPISVKPDEGKLWMTYCSGTPLHQLLREPNDSIVEHLDHIAVRIAEAAECYTREFREPFFTLSTHNMLYDKDNSILTLIDFTLPRRLRNLKPCQPTIDVSLGIFLGLTTSHTVRPCPGELVTRTYWNRQKQLSVGVVSAVRRNHSLDTSLVSHVSHDVYRRRRHLGRLRRVRQTWHETFGKALFSHRIRTILSDSRSIDPLLEMTA